MIDTTDKEKYVRTLPDAFLDYQITITDPTEQNIYVSPFLHSTNLRAKSKYSKAIAQLDEARREIR